MDVKKTNIKRFITSSDTVFVIPVYQRNYDYEMKNHELFHQKDVNFCLIGTKKALTITESAYFIEF